MSTDNNIWMGDIKPWMNESFILKSFNYYNIYPLNVKLIHDKNTNELKNYCFISFESVEEANKCIIMLNGKQIPNTLIKFKLNWATYFSNFNKSVYVGNLSPDVDDISLFNLFKEKYSTVHHASVIMDKGKSKGFGFILFRGEKEYERCLNEMNGIKFHGNYIKVNEQKKKDDDNKINVNENSDNFENNINSNINENHHYQNKSNNNETNSLNNISNLNKIKNNNFPNISNIKNNRNYNNINNINNFNNNNSEQSSFSFLNSNNNNNQHIINNIININNVNKINNINYINDINSIYNKNILNKNNNLINNNNNNININNSINDITKNNLKKQNSQSLYPNINYSNINKSIENNDNSSFLPIRKSLDNNNIKNNNIRINYIYNIRNINLNQNQKIANSSEYKLDIFNDFDNSTLKRKIKENLDKMYDYYSEKYPGDINKLRCKLYLFLFIIFL